MTSQAQDASFVSDFDAAVTTNYSAFAAAALLICEYLATFPDEVDLFWRRRCTGASVLFFMNRYAPLLFYILVNTNFWMLTDAVCHAFVKACWIFSLLQYVPWAGFSALRVYALSRDLTISCLVFFLSSVTIGINLAHLWPFSQTIIVPRLGCIEYDTTSVEVQIGFVTASKASLILADIIVIAVTWVKLGRRTRGLSGKHSLMHILLRDGTIYFICLLTLNTLDLTLSELSIAGNSPYTISYLVLFTEPLTAVLVSRFMLNLQAVDQRSRNYSSTPHNMESQTVTGSLLFERIVGSLSSSDLSDSGASATVDEHQLELVGRDKDPMVGET
ncbi:hypothetical protein C8Q76DRAFT_192384 [Earliella scabrosa]|nr:hypothetical protein C8Q76DRAFT_192384 [Earliella scabrosa]